jgi:MSHA biogenesis protein MshL
VTVREALDAIRELFRFEYRVDGNRIFVSAPELQTRLFKVSFPTINRTGSSTVRVVSGSLTNSPAGATGQPGAPGAVPGAVPGATPGAPGVPGQTGAGSVPESSRVTTNVRSDLWGEIEATIRLLVGDKAGASVVVSPQTGTIVVRAMPAEMREVERYLKAARLDIERQVMLEAKIVEVQLTDSFQSGINWAAFRSTQSNGLLSSGRPARPPPRRPAAC